MRSCWAAWRQSGSESAPPSVDNRVLVSVTGDVCEADGSAVVTQTLGQTIQRDPVLAVDKLAEGAAECQVVQRRAIVEKGVAVPAAHFGLAEHLADVVDAPRLTRGAAQCAEIDDLLRADPENGVVARRAGDEPGGIDRV